jgi:hypothetical protein
MPKPIYTTLTLDDNNKALLKRWLGDIWDLGDRDEQSWKHVGHGIAALLAHDNWKEAVDYNEPKYEMTREELVKLDALWACIYKIVKLAGKQKVLNTLPDLANEDSRFMYVNTYLDYDWLGYTRVLEEDGYYPKVD